MIRVYTGYGISRNGAPLLLEELSKYAHTEVAGINEHEMLGSREWEKTTSTLIFAGQSVTQFKAALGEERLNDIRRSIHEGAFDYVGICAGSAFAFSHIKYRMKPVNPEKPLLIQNTGLSIIHGLATGPCRSVSPLPFSGGTENLHLITLCSTTDYQPFNSFHWGGPALIPLEKIPHDRGRMLSFLQSDGTPMAIRSHYGQGKVTLLSYHPEIHAGNIGRWAEARYLPDAEAQRLEVLAGKLDGTAFSRFLNDAGIAHRERLQWNAQPRAQAFL